MSLLRALAVPLLLVLATGCLKPADDGGDGTPTPPGTAPPSTSVPPGTTPPSPTTPGATTSRPPMSGFPVFEDFELGLGQWQSDAAVPLDPDRPGEDVAWNVTWTDSAGWEDHVHIVGHPVHSAKFCVDGRQGDGTVWLEKAFRVHAGTYNVTASFHGWSQDGSANTIAHAVLYVGSDNPETEDDFPAAGVSGTHGSGGGLRQPLDQASGWTTYEANFTLHPKSETVWVAVGISLVWETQACYPLDALTVSLTPV